MRLLTSSDVASLLGVSTGTVKRWSDDGRIECVRTAGRHRRYTLESVERFRRGRDGAAGEGRSFVDRLLGDEDVLGLQAALLEQRARLGAWWRVAAWLAPEIEDLGRRWEDGTIGIVEEHLASERLVRALSRCSESLPSRPSAPRVLLATAEGEEHLLGLALVEVCLREAGWNVRWSGRRTPSAEIVRLVEAGGVDGVAVSASVAAERSSLAAQAATLGAVCRRKGVHLLVGGRGAWPDPLASGRVVREFEGLRAWMDGVEAVRRPAESMAL
jgi:excisionase family DNA binding protein